MNNYHLIKNTQWKEVEINGEMKEIPRDWDVIIIGDIILSNEKSIIKAGEAGLEGNYPFFNCSEKQTKYFNNFLVDGENIFLTTGGDYMFTLYHNGKSAYSTDVWSVKIKEENAKFISYLLKNNYQLNQSYFRGFKFKHLDKKGFKEMMVYIPPLPIQSSIAFILSAQESIIAEIESLISKYETRFQYLSEELLSGRLRVKKIDGKNVLYKNPEDNWKEVEINGEMKEIPKDWDVEKLKKHILVINGYAFPKSQMLNEKTNNSVPIIKIGNIHDDTIVENSGTGQNYYNGISKDSFIPQCNDLIIGLSGANAGKTGIYKLLTKTVLNQRNAIVRIQSHVITQDFFNYFWFKDALEALRETTKDSAIPNISSEDIENIDVFIFSKVEQSSIASILSQQESLIEEQKNLLEKEKEKFDWILDNLLSGKYLVKEKNER